MLMMEVSLWLKGLKWLMIDWMVSGLGTGVVDEGCSHFIGMTGELSTNLPRPFSLRGVASASLPENRSLATISNGASPTALSTLGGPPSRTSSSSDE